MNITERIVKDLEPLLVVEQERFRNLIKTNDHCYIVPVLAILALYLLRNGLIPKFAVSPILSSFVGLQHRTLQSKMEMVCSAPWHFFHLILYSIHECIGSNVQVCFILKMWQGWGSSCWPSAGGWPLIHGCSLSTCILGENSTLTPIHISQSFWSSSLISFKILHCSFFTLIQKIVFILSGLYCTVFQLRDT